TALVILWASAFLSAIIDNIPFVATMIPVIKNMAPTFGGPAAILPLWWSLSLGACLGGNGTLIGASANLTVAGIAERAGVPFRFLTFLTFALPMMLMSVAISMVYVWLRYLWLLRHSEGDVAHGPYRRISHRSATRERMEGAERSGDPQ